MLISSRSSDKHDRHRQFLFLIGFISSSMDMIFDFWCFRATFNNISAISWRSALVVEEAEVPGENDPEQATGKLYHLRLRVECTFL
jgi:hypothetical protein